MNPLGDLQQDALTEMFNIGVGRAASSLSQIVRDEVLLTAPEILFLSPGEVSARLIGTDSRRLSMVSQDFSGPFDAKAILLFHEDNALTLVGLMMGSRLKPADLSEFAQEALCEVGNVILNSCISAMADLFHVKFEGGLPQYQLVGIQLPDLHEDGETHAVLMLQVTLHVRNSLIGGNLLFLLSISSWGALLACIDDYLVRRGLHAR